MKKLLVAMLIIFICLSGLFAQEMSLADKFKKYMGPELAAQLSGKEKASAVFKEKETPKLLPKVFSESRIRNEIKDMNVTFGVEICRVQKFKNKTDTKAKLLGIYNLLLSVRSLKGILYYSESRKTMREFIYDSYRIASHDNKTPLPDIQLTEMTPSKTIYTYQHDSSFEENTYQVTFRALEGYFLMEMINTSHIWYGIIPIVDPGNLRYYIMVIPVDDALLFYSMICVSGANPFGIMEGKAASFLNRIKALETWFLDNYKDVE